MIDCGIEQIDVDIFGNGSVLAIFLIPMVTEKGKDLTYQDLFDKIIKFKKSPEYDNIVEAFKTSTILSKRKAVLKNWENDKKLLEKLDMSEKSINEFHNFLRTNEDPNKTYKEIFEAFRLKEKELRKEEKERYSYLIKNDGVLNYSDLLDKAKELQKPILLYFNGYACINSRKMEESILTKSEIAKKLTNDFIFVNVFIDDKKEIPKNEWFIDEKTGKIINTIGKKNAKFQIDNFNNNISPYFVILDKNGNKLRERGYTKELQVFDKFLDLSK